jgi:3-hydroxybenzoate 6-monooxygenase
MTTGARNEAPILIVGGGIGGLAAALALARMNLSSHVLERAAEFRELGAGIQLGPNGFKALAALGLSDYVWDVAFFPDDIAIRDSASGRLVLQLPVGSQEFRARYEHPYAVIYRPDLLDLLLAACRRSPLIELSTEQEVIGFDDDGERITAFTVAGVAHEGCALVGADGLWSRVRQIIVSDGEPRRSGHIAYRAVLPLDEVEERLRPNAVVLWSGPGRHLVHYPLRRGELFNLVAVFQSDHHGEDSDAHDATDELYERFRVVVPDVQSLLAKIDIWRKWTLHDREPVSSWSSGRATLLGDAAHPMLQYLAQGACMAIEDGLVLAANVAKHAHDYESAFLAYQRARYVRTARAQLTSRFYGDAFHASGVTADVRDQILGDLGPAVAAERMSWLYDGIAA